MIGDAFKGILFLAIIGFACLGAATVLPESAWEKLPPKLLPLRQYLADQGIISDKFCHSKTIRVPAAIHCSGGICRIDGITNNQEGSEESDALSQNDDLAQEKSSSPSFDPLSESLPQNTETPLTADLESPAPLEEGTSSSPLQDLPQGPLYEEDLSAQNDSQSAVSALDTLPNLQFERTLPPPSAGENLAASPAPLSNPTTEPFPASSEEEGFVSSSAISPDSPFPAAPGNENISVAGGIYPEGESFPNANSLPLESQGTPTFPEPNRQVSFETSEPLPSFSASSAAVNSESLHQQIEDAVRLSEESGQTKLAFLKLNEILNQNDSALTIAERSQLNDALDRLAFDVFYNPETSILVPNYVTGSQETLASIAAQYQISPELLGAINSISQDANQPLPSGRRLKVIEGPVTANVSFSRMELLLKFNGLYAGRFKMGCAQRAREIRGDFEIVRKIENPDYNGPLANGQIGQIAGGDPNNPLGPCWIELTGGLGLQGTNRPELIGQQSAPLGGLIFSNKDIAHLNILLSEGAKIRITD